MASTARMLRYPVIPVSIERAAPTPHEHTLALSHLEALTLDWSFPNFWPDASDKAKQIYNRFVKPPTPPQATPPPQPAYTQPQPAWTQPPSPPQPAWTQPAPVSPSPAQSLEEILRYIEEVHTVTGQIIALMRGMPQPTQESQQQQQKRVCVLRRADPL